MSATVKSIDADDLNGLNIIGLKDFLLARDVSTTGVKKDLLRLETVRQAWGNFQDFRTWPSQSTVESTLHGAHVKHEQTSVAAILPPFSTVWKTSLLSKSQKFWRPVPPSLKHGEKGAREPWTLGTCGKSGKCLMVQKVWYEPCEEYLLGHGKCSRCPGRLWTRKGSHCQDLWDIYLQAAAPFRCKSWRHRPRQQKRGKYPHINKMSVCTQIPGPHSSITS